jgi:hypothetical protein
MTPEEEAQVKDQIWAEMRQRLGDEYMKTHAKFLEAQWEWIKELGMIDPKTDLVS